MRFEDDRAAGRSLRELRNIYLPPDGQPPGHIDFG
jgi:hypothetical protein